MCGRYTIVSKLETLEKRFQAKATQPEKHHPQINVSVGQLAPVVTPQKEIVFFRFGLTPFWSKKPMYLFNARSEGDHNAEDSMHYRGAMGIFQKPSFRKPIRSQRCLIPADSFFEGPKEEKLSKPFLVYLRDQQRPFAFAGIWDEWADPTTGEIHNGFAIITTQANELMQRIGHPRSPVILHPEDESAWLDPDLPTEELVALMKPFPANQMNAYPVSPAMKNPRAQGMDVLQPVGDRIFPETTTRLSQEVRLEGMGMTQARIRKNRESTD